MSGFALPTNFIENLESLLRKPRLRLVLPEATLPANEPLASTPSATITMAQKTLHEFSIPAIANMLIGPAINVGDKNIEFRTELITMVHANPFCGLLSKDANAHLQHFLELCDAVIRKDVAPEIIRLRLFPFSLMGKAKQ